MELRYNSLAGLVRAATESGRQISELVLADQAKQMERDPKLLFQEMDRRLTVMDEAADVKGDTRTARTSRLHAERLQDQQAGAADT